MVYLFISVTVPHLPLFLTVNEFASVLAYQEFQPAPNANPAKKAAPTGQVNIVALPAPAATSPQLFAAYVRSAISPSVTDLLANALV